MATVYEALQEIESTPGLEAALRRFARTGSCAITPPIVGALTRLDVFALDRTHGAAMARQIVALLDEYRAALITMSRIRYLTTEQPTGIQYGDDDTGATYWRECYGGRCGRWEQVTLDPCEVARWRAEREQREARNG